MNAKKSISIACASAFWGDTPFAVSQLLREPQLDYIAFDYLSEVTMTLLARFKKKDPTAGYVPDFLTDVIEPHLKTCIERKIKLVSNAGAMNPVGLKKKIEEVAAAQGFKVNIICVEGDDLLAAKALPESVTDMDGRSWKSSGFLSANAYLGSPALVQALSLGADIVLTGRSVDTAVITAPIIHEFGWKWTDYDLLAQASLAGHIVECGTQCTGGNFTDWQKVSGSEDMGFPILRFESSGEFVLNKSPRSGGLINTATVAEQIVYEIGNPKAYLLPDVICDFTNVNLIEEKNGVRVKGAKGSAPTSSYKVSATLQEGWKISATAFIAGGDAKIKAQAIGKTLLSRCERILNEKSLPAYSSTRLETLGGGDEVLLRLSATHSQPDALDVLAKEIAPAATSLAPGMTNLLGGRASATPRIRLVNLLIDKKDVKVQVDRQGEKLPVEIPVTNGKVSESESFKTSPHKGRTQSVPLSQLAYARSGDKGNHANVGVIARKPEYLEVLKRELTIDKLKDFFSEDFDSSDKQIEVWEMPGIHALNFLILNCLGGGGAYSLKVDPQGKAFAQRLLQIQIAVPEEIL